LHIVLKFDFQHGFNYFQEIKKAGQSLFLNSIGKYHLCRQVFKMKSRKRREFSIIRQNQLESPFIEKTVRLLKIQAFH